MRTVSSYHKPEIFFDTAGYVVPTAISKSITCRKCAKKVTGDTIYFASKVEKESYFVVRCPSCSNTAITKAEDIGALKYYEV